jgi:GxxExxY protein
MDPDHRKLLDSLVERILGAVFEVANTLGPGFLEKVYERALLRELRLRSLSALSQAPFSVAYKDECVGDFYADILVGGALVLKLKCVEHLTNEHLAQCLNYRMYHRAIEALQGLNKHHKTKEPWPAPGHPQE